MAEWKTNPRSAESFRVALRVAVQDRVGQDHLMSMLPESNVGKILDYCAMMMHASDVAIIAFAKQYELPAPRLDVDFETYIDAAVESALAAERKRKLRTP